MGRSRRARRMVALCLTGLLQAGLIAFDAGVGVASDGATTYRNPISRDFADTFADPAIIRAKDGYWYAYGTSDPLREGEGDFHYLPVARSNNLVDWDYVGDVLTDANRPDWAAPDSSFWAPDIRYLDGTYYLYYVATQTTVTPEQNDNAIGVLTAPTPTGPWTDSGAPVVGPRRGGGGPGDFKWTFDPSEFTDEDGTRYLYYGSYYGGIWVTRLSEDGKRAVGDSTMVAIDNRYEGAYVIRHGRFYYLFASSADCCAGPTTGYSVFVGRATDPRGPFLDRQGDSMTQSRVGGSIVITPNGNKWIGTGHNAVVTDLAGQDWFVYHAINRNDPYLDEPFGINERPMLIDRLDWINEWPTVRRGKWASQGEQRGPVGTWSIGDEFNRNTSLGREWDRITGAWSLEKSDEDARGYVVQHSASCNRVAYLVSEQRGPGNFRAEADLRLPRDRDAAAAVGLVAAYKNRGNNLVAWLDRAAHALVTDVRVGGVSAGPVPTPLPPNFEFDAWHNVAMEVRGSSMKVEVTDARLNDPLAVQRRALPPEAGGQGAVGVAGRCGRVEADNVGVAELYRPVTSRVPPPRVGPVDRTYSDGFNDGRLEQEWEWVRKPDGQEIGGAYRWPTQNADLHKESNSASVMLRDAPQGKYTVDTKLRIDLGTDTVRNYQQAGLVTYVGDNRYLKLVHVAIWNTRQTEFAKEMPFADGISYGGMLVGPPSDVTWLRVSHRIDPKNGEHEFRAATRAQGERWRWGGVWTMPARTTPRIGLVSMGGSGATAEFDYFRVHRP